MSGSFQGRLAKNIGWQGLNMLIRIGMSVVALALLTRLGGPEIMGIYGITWVLPAIFLAILQTGMAQSVFLVERLTKGHRTAAFLSSMGVAALGALTMALLGSVAARYYDLPALRTSFPSAALFTLLMGLGVVDLAMTQKKLDFRTVAMVQTLANLISSLFGVLLGYLGYPLLGLLALQGTLSPLQFLIFRLRHEPMEFAWPSLSETRDVWRHGVHLMLNTLTANVQTNYAQLILASTLPIGELGLFTLSRRIVELIHNQIGGIANQVLFPSFAARRNNLDDVAHIYLVMSRITAAVVLIPLVVIICAPVPFLQLFGGPKWVTGQNVLVMLCLMQGGLALGQNLFGVMQATGHAATVWKWNIGFTLWQCTLVVVFGRHSASAAGAAMAISSLAIPFAAYLLSRFIHFRMIDWAINYVGVFAAALLTIGLLQFINEWFVPDGFRVEIFFAINLVVSTAIYLCFVVTFNFRFIRKNLIR